MKNLINKNMKGLEIISSNVLIDGFMNKTNVFKDSELKYHSSWDWLIPVCRKFDNLNVMDNNYIYTLLCDDLDHYMTLYKIEDVYRQIIKCIKWYNGLK